MTTENIYRAAFLITFIIVSLFFFDVIRIDMEDKTYSVPIYMSGEPADMPHINERLEQVESAFCSSSKKGEAVVRLAALSVLKQKADEVGGNGLVDVTTSYGKHPDLDDQCPYGISVHGTAVVFDD